MTRVLRKIAGLMDHLRNAEGLSRPDETPFEPLQIESLTVRCETSWPVDAAFLQKWKDLSIQLPAGTPFHGPAWQIAGWTAGRILGRIRFITVDRAGELLAVLPLCLNPNGGLHSPGASISDYLDPLIVPEHEPACWAAILAFVADQWDRKIVEFTLHNNREWAACRCILPTLAETAGFSLEETLVEYAPAIQ